MKTMIKKQVCILLALLLLLAPISTAVQAKAATQFEYPAGVSAAKAEEIVSSTDSLLLKATETMSGKPLAENVTQMLYESELLSSLLVGIYSAMSSPDMAEMLSMLSMSVSPADLSAVLYAYPEISKALSGAASWDSVNLSNAKWNISNKTEFATAFGVMLSPLHTMLQFLLCEGSFNVVGNIIKVDGGKGYETAVIPIYEAFGCTQYLSYSDYKAQSTANASATGANLITPLLNYIEDVLTSPLTKLCSALPNLAWFITHDGFEDAINALLAPITDLAATIEKIPLLNSMLAGSNLDDLSSDFSGNLVPDLNTMLSDSGMNITLPEIDWELLASCGTYTNGKVTANKGQTFVVVFRWIWEVLQSNSDAMSEMLTQGMSDAQPTDSAFSVDFGSIIDEFLRDDADTVIKALAFMLKPDTKPSDLYWVYGNISPTAYTFNENMPRENYGKMIAGFDNLLGALIAEMLGAASLETAVNNALYTNDNITAVLKTVYSMFDGEELSGIAALLNLDVSVKSVLGKLTEAQYAETVSFLSRFNTWEEIPADGLSWGFADGDRAGFVATLAAMFRPLNGLLGFMLAGQDFVLLDSITIRGTNGYNSAIIPLFEALGTDASTYVSFAEYKASTDPDQMLTSILTPLFLQIEKICAAPVVYLTKQLPTICYFISDGGLQKMLYSLAVPILEFVAGSGLSIDIMSVIEEIMQFDLTFGEEQVKELITQLQNSENGMSMALPEIPALTTLASLGTLKEYESKRTFKDRTTTYKAVEADEESVLAYLVDFVVSMMQMPENGNMLMGSIGGGDAAEGENPFAAYSDTMAAEMENMTHDDMVRWFYDMLVFESSAEEETENQMEIPHIIYEEAKEEGSGAGVIAVVILLIAVATVAVIVIRKKKYGTKKKKSDNNEAAETEE